MVIDIYLESSLLHQGTLKLFIELALGRTILSEFGRRINRIMLAY